MSICALLIKRFGDRKRIGVDGEYGVNIAAEGGQRDKRPAKEELGARVDLLDAV